MYKDEKQLQNKIKLEKLLEQYRFPRHFKNYFINGTVRSKQAMLNYLSTINNFFLWCLEKNIIHDFNNVDSITPGTVREYLNSLIETEGYKYSTVNTKKNQIRSFFNFLVEEKMINDNPVTKSVSCVCKIKHKKDPNKLPNLKDLELLENNLNKIPNIISRTKYISLYQVLKGTGLREIELCGLELKDIHLNEELPYIDVLRKGSYRKEEYEVVYMSKSAYNAIQEWLIFRDKLNPKCDALFLTRSGDRIKEDNIIKVFKKYSQGTITPHMLRHLYTSELYRTTKDLAFVQEQCGHSLGSSVTIDVYAHGSDDSKQVLLKM